jgi:hypothetical protein
VRAWFGWPQRHQPVSTYTVQKCWHGLAMSKIRFINASL